MRALRREIQRLESAEGSPSDPQGRETVRVRALPDEIQTEASPDASQVRYPRVERVRAHIEIAGHVPVAGQRRPRRGHRHRHRRRDRGARDNDGLHVDRQKGEGGDGEIGASPIAEPCRQRRHPHTVEPVRYTYGRSAGTNGAGGPLHVDGHAQAALTLEQQRRFPDES